MISVKFEQCIKNHMKISSNFGKRDVRQLSVERSKLGLWLKQLWFSYREGCRKSLIFDDRLIRESWKDKGTNNIDKAFGYIQDKTNQYYYLMILLSVSFCIMLLVFYLLIKIKGSLDK